MKMKGTDNMMANGHVVAALVSPDGRHSVVAEGHNTLLYRCADAVARLFAGESAYRPTTIGFVCATEADKGSAFAFPDPDDPRTTKTQAELVGSGLYVKDVQVEPAYAFSATPPTEEELEDNPHAVSHYQGNKVTFRAMTVDNDETEYVYGFLLKDAAGRVLAVKKFDKAVERTEGFAMAASWTVTFN
jgi:hypothetical protein